jgi:hypothetical protein
LDSKERAMRAIMLEEADRVAVSEYDINSPVASVLMGEEMFVGYGGRFMDLCYRMIYEERRNTLVDRMKRDRVRLYSRLGLDIMMVRPVWGRNPVKPKPVAPYEWIVEGPDGHWFRYKFNLEYDSISQIDSSIARGGLEALKDYVDKLCCEPIEIDGEELELVEYAVKSVGDLLFLRIALYKDL